MLTKLLNIKKAEDKYSISSTLELLFLLCALVLINLIVFSFKWQFDFTKDKVYSLNKETINYVKKIDKATEIYFLCSAEALTNYEISQVDLVLKLVASKNKLINYKVVDPDKDPATLSKFNADATNNLKMGTLIVNRNNSTKIVDFLNLISYSFDENKSPTAQSLNVENSLLSALQYVEKGQNFKAYNILGHGESSFQEIMQMGERSFFNTLDEYNYTVEGLTLANKAIPADASMLFILSPKTDLDPSEKISLVYYLERGGKLLVNLELSENKLPILFSLLNDYGIKAKPSLVAEYQQDRLWIESNSNPIFFQVEFPSNDINKTIINKDGTVFVGGTLSLEVANPLLRTITITPLMKSSSKAKIVEVSDDGKTTAPIEKQATVAMLSQKKINANNNETVASVVVLTGRSDIMQKFDGPYWFGSLLSYLTGDKNHIQVENKSLVELPIRYKSVVIVFLIAFVFVLVVPISLIAIGTIIYFRRKNL